MVHKMTITVKYTYEVLKTLFNKFWFLVLKTLFPHFHLKYFLIL